MVLSNSISEQIRSFHFYTQYSTIPVGSIPYQCLSFLNAKTVAENIRPIISSVTASPR